MTARLSVTGAFVRVEHGMGQQIADEHLLNALREHPGLDVRELSIGPLRARVTLDRRIPLGLLNRPRTSAVAQRAVGQLVYPRGLVHRFDCRLPPAPHEVVTVHDLAPLRFRDEGVMPPNVGESLRRAAAVVCPSEFSAQELRDEYGLDRVFVVPNGLADEFREARPLTPAALQEMGLPVRYVMHMGGATSRKNLTGLADAWQRLNPGQPDVGLVLCGPPDARRTELFARLPRTHLLGKVPRRTLVGLMAGASAVVVPSVYEGFGLPVLEAMACGVPVVAAACSALPEVLRGSGRLVEPHGQALAEGLSEALRDPGLFDLHAARERALSASWFDSARAYGQIYAEVS